MDLPVPIPKQKHFCFETIFLEIVSASAVLNSIMFIKVVSFLKILRPPSICSHVIEGFCTLMTVHFYSCVARNCLRVSFPNKHRQWPQYWSKQSFVLSCLEGQVRFYEKIFVLWISISITRTEERTISYQCCTEIRQDDFIVLK